MSRVGVRKLRYTLVKYTIMKQIKCKSYIIQITLDGLKKHVQI